MILPLGMNSVINDLIDSYLARRLGDQWNIRLGRGGLIAGVLPRAAKKKFGYPPEMPEGILLLRLQTPKNRVSSESLGTLSAQPTKCFRDVTRIGTDCAKPIGCCAYLKVGGRPCSHRSCRRGIPDRRSRHLCLRALNARRSPLGDDR